MARPLRIEFPGAWYHVMNRGANRQNIFLDDSDRFRFLEILDDCRDTWLSELLAYCLMPNHYHLLLRTPLGNLSRIMRHVDGVYTQSFNRKQGRDGPLLRGRYKSIVLDGDSYLLQVVRYIHLNPTKAKLVLLPEDYHWSSYKFYLGELGKPKALLTKPVLELFGSGSDTILEFQRHTQAGVDEETDAFYSRKKLKPAFGKPAFLTKLRKTIASTQKPDAEVPDSKALLRQASLEDVCHLVEQAYEVNRNGISSSQRGRVNEARDCLAYLARTRAGYSLRSIAEFLGGVSYVAVNLAVERMKQRIAENFTTRQRVEELLNSLRRDVDVENILQLKT